MFTKFRDRIRQYSTLRHLVRKTLASGLRTEVRPRLLILEGLEDRRLLSVAPHDTSHGPAGVDVPFGVFTHEEYEALENVPFDSSLSSKTPPPNLDGGHESDVLTIVLDFKEPGQGNTSDIFGNVVTEFDVTAWGFTAGQFNTVANAVLAEVEEDYFDELVGTVAGPPGQDLAIDFVIGDIGTPPPGVSEYYFVQIGTGISGPHSGGTLGVAGGSVVRNSSGSGPNFGISVGDVVSSVFTDAIVTLGGLTPSNALTSGNLGFTTHAITGTTSHEVGHTASLSHINKAGSTQPTGLPPIMGTGAIDLPNQDRIGDREFSLSGVDAQNGNAPRQHIQQLVDAIGLHGTGAGMTGNSGDLYYLIDTGPDQLVTVDTAGTVTVVGPFGADPEALAYDSRDDILYGLETNGTDGLYTINRATGTATLLGAIGVDVSFGLTYNPLDDLLYSITSAHELVQIDPDTLTATVVTSPGPTGGVSGLAFNPVDQRLYAHSNTAPRVYSYDAVTFSGPIVHATPSVSSFHGMTHNGTSLVVADGPLADENIYSYDAVSGAAAPLFATDILNGLATDGMTFIPQTNSIRGQKWEDINGNEVRDVGEPGLNGWTIELLDSQGNVVDTRTTADNDLDSSGTIDPETERGLYLFNGLPDGVFTVREVPQIGWEQTALDGGGAQSLFAVDSSLDNLYKLSGTTGTETLVGSTLPGPVTPAGLAWTGSAMYMMDLNTGRLYTVDLDSGATTLQGTGSSGQWQSLAADPTDNGQLYSVDVTNDNLYRIARDGTPTLVGGGAGSLIAALEFDSAGVLWAIDFSGDFGTINKTTGAFTVLGTTLGGFQGLDFDTSGQMYAANTNNSSLYKIDTTTGAATLVGANGTQFVKGLAFSGQIEVVPELLYYGFDEGSGTLTENLAAPGVGSNQAVVSGHTLTGDGAFGTALTGSGGTANSVDTGWQTALGTDSWTLGLWIDRSDYAGTSLSYVFGDTTANGFRAFFNGLAGANNIILRGGGITDVVIPGGAPTNAGVAVAWVYDSEAGEITGYLNGQPVVTVPQAALNITGTGNFFVGSYTNGSNSLAADARIDEFRLYDRGLSAAEVAAAWSSGGTPHEDDWLVRLSNREAVEGIDFGNKRVAPRVVPAGTTLNANANNRSGINEIQVQFDQPVTASGSNALRLFNHSTSSIVSTAAATVSGDGTSTLTWSQLGSLPDGRYTAELIASQISGNSADLAVTYAFEFHVLRGDMNGDAAVNFADYGVVGANFDPLSGVSYRDGDANGDGFVNFADYGIIGANFDPIGLAALVYDFGDAPEIGTSFATLLANNGAQHVIAGPTLGVEIDSESDGVPTANADGDDLAGTPDDEEGIAAINLQAGQTTNFTLTASVLGTAFVNAWIDFNGDGDWNDAGEQVLSDEPVVNGPNTKSFVVPGNAATTSVVARFRINEVVGYGHDGFAANGEVEDYLFTISPPPPSGSFAGSAPGESNLLQPQVDLVLPSIPSRLLPDSSSVFVLPAEHEYQVSPLAANVPQAIDQALIEMDSVGLLSARPLDRDTAFAAPSELLPYELPVPGLGRFERLLVAELEEFRQP